jgi:DNA repair protein RecN (Recombination protein N)
MKMLRTAMLRHLAIRDMLLIDRLELEFQPGLNVLTGETGAGKSILLDSLGFVLGWRGRAELVRAGAAQGEVEAVFDLPRPPRAHAVLARPGSRRKRGTDPAPHQHADGRKTAWINDRRASGEVLRALSDTLVELHGQHDDRGLLNPRGHRQLLDAFAGAEPLLATHPRRLARTLAAARASAPRPPTGSKRCAPKRTICATPWPNWTSSPPNPARRPNSTPAAG